MSHVGGEDGNEKKLHPELKSARHSMETATRADVRCQAVREAEKEQIGEEMSKIFSGQKSKRLSLTGSLYHGDG